MHQSLIELTSRIGDALPARMGVALRSRFGNSREAEMAMIHLLLPIGGLAVDVGANKGLWTYQLANRAGQLGGVIAVEPQRHLYQYLGKAFRKYHGVEMYNCALSEREGERLLQVPQHGGRLVRGRASLEDITSESISERVQVRSLDGLLSGRVPDLIKIDVEGHHREVLAGASATIYSGSPSLIVELETGQFRQKSAESFDFLVQACGYRAYWIERGALARVEAFPPTDFEGTANVVFLA